MQGPDDRPLQDSAPPATSSASEIGDLLEAVRRLIVAVWCLVAVLLASVAVPYVTYFVQAARFSREGHSSNARPSPSTAPYSSDFDNDFHARPVEEKIRRATVILLAVHREEGGRHKSIVREIVKQAPGVSFYYRLGDELEMLGHRPAPGCGRDCEGDGEVVFLIGNPAMMAQSVSYSGDRIDGMGGLSLSELRRLAQAPAKAGS